MAQLTHPRANATGDSARAGSWGGPLQRIGAFVRSHWQILVLLALAAALHGVAWLAVHPARWIIGDSIGYLDDLFTRTPDRWRPSGYSFLVLGPLQVFHRLSLVTAVQHAMGLAIGVMIYAVLLRLGVRRWVAALATVPVLFDGYLLATEQLLGAETLFVFLVTGALVLLMWRIDRPPLPAVAAAGALLALATATRIVGEPVIAVAAIVLLLPRPAWTRLVALGVAFAVPVALYASWFHQIYGTYNLTASNGIFLYGRTTNFVECQKVHFTSQQLRSICPKEPVGQRNEVWYVFDVDSPIAKLGVDVVAANDLAQQFAIEAIEAQPSGYAALAWQGLVQTFEWDQSHVVNDLLFQIDPPLPDAARVAAVTYQGQDPGPLYRPTLIRALGVYQGYGSVPGTAILLALILALVALVFGRDPDHHGLRQALVLAAGTTAVLLLIPALTAIVQPRYRVPAIPAACITAALAVTLLANRRARLQPRS